MKKLNLSLLFALLVIAGIAQTNPVTFDYKVRKLEAKVYEVTIIANIASPWHIYAQFRPGDGPSIPTSINFGKNPLVEIVGQAEERGNLVTKHDEVLNADL